MNKLAPIALILLLSFGGALWYLANNSLNEHIRSRIIQVGEYYTELKVSVDAVEVSLSQGLGKMSGLRLYDDKQPDESIITIKNIIFSFEPIRIKKDKIVISNITFTDISVHASKTIQNNAGGATNIKQLLDLLNSKIALIRDARKQKAEPYMQVEKLQLENISITIGDVEKRQLFHTLPAVGRPAGLPSSLFGIEVFRQILIHVTNNK